MSLASKTSFSTNSSLYSTPCQSPGSLGSLDSTQISLTSKESLTTTGPSDNLGLLAIQGTFNSNGRNSSRPNSSSSGCSFNSVRTLLPPSSSINSTSTWKPGQLNGTNSQGDASKSFNTNNLCWQNLFQLRRDLTLKLSAARQQVQLIAHQLDELETEMCDRLDALCQQFNGHDNNGKISPNGTFLVSTTFGREAKMSISNEIRVQLSKLAEIPIIQKLPAMVKGYLTRRLMTTSKVKNLIKTIKDTTILLENYHGEDQVDQEEIGFHRRLMVQLEKSLAEFHDIFFAQNKAEQMKLIARTRENPKERPWRLSTEARRQQAEKAKKFIHDKRKDSPLLTNLTRVFRQNDKKEPEKKENDKETEKASKNYKKEEKEKEKEEKHKSEAKEIRPTTVPELTPEPTPVPILDEKSKDSIEEETEKDIEMKTIDEEIPETESKAKIKGKARPKAITKPRKSAKSTKKTQAINNKEPLDKPSSPSLTSSSSVPTPPSQAPPSDPPSSSATDASEIPEDEKESEVNKESAPKRPKRTATATKRVTRAAKKT